MEWNYETIKDVAKRTKRRVTDLIVLARQNDPFYMGSPASQEQGEWFAEKWRLYGYAEGVHLRRSHYQIASQELSKRLMTNGKPYENTMNCWAWLGQAAKAARYLGMVDADDFDDRRNPEVISFVPERRDVPSIHIFSDSGEYDVQLPDFPSLPRYFAANYEGRQRYHVEVWCEKSTQNDILIPLCQEYGAALQTGMGEQSITRVNKAARRIADMGYPAARILYISDFDPAGLSMPVTTARKLEFFIRGRYPSVDMRLVPIALSKEQVIEYQLPRIPIKDDEKRKPGFEERFGEGATELDALEALHPGTLHNLVRSELCRYHDARLGADVWVARSRLYSDLDARRQEVIAAHAEEIAALEGEYEQIKESLEARLASHTHQRDTLWRAIAAEMEDALPDIADYPIPEAREGNEHDHPLYDSRRDCLEQRAVYKAFQGKGGDPDDEDDEGEVGA